MSPDWVFKSGMKSGSLVAGGGGAGCIQASVASMRKDIKRTENMLMI